MLVTRCCFMLIVSCQLLLVKAQLEEPINVVYQAGFDIMDAGEDLSNIAKAESIEDIVDGIQYSADHLLDAGKNIVGLGDHLLGMVFDPPKEDEITHDVSEDILGKDKEILSIIAEALDDVIVSVEQSRETDSDILEVSEDILGTLDDILGTIQNDSNPLVDIMDTIIPPFDPIIDIEGLLDGVVDAVSEPNKDYLYPDHITHEDEGMDIIGLIGDILEDGGGLSMVVPLEGDYLPKEGSVLNVGDIPYPSRDMVGYPPQQEEENHWLFNPSNENVRGNAQNLTYVNTTTLEEAPDGTIYSPYLKVKQYKCDYEDEIIPSTQLKSYYICKRFVSGLRPVSHDCEGTEIYNSTMQACHPLLGGGKLAWVSQEDCAQNTAPVKYFDWSLWRHYQICYEGTNIIGVCDSGWYFNEKEKACKQEEEIKTIFVRDDQCHEYVSYLLCTKPGVFPINFGTNTKGGLLVISGEDYFSYSEAEEPSECQNCYYECNTVDDITYELSVTCLNGTMVPNDQIFDSNEKVGNDEHVPSIGNVNCLNTTTDICKEPSSTDIDLGTEDQLTIIDIVDLLDYVINDVFDSGNDNETAALVPETTMKPYLADDGTTTPFLPQIILNDALLFESSDDDDDTKAAVQEIIVEPTSTVNLNNGTICLNSTTGICKEPSSTTTEDQLTISDIIDLLDYVLNDVFDTGNNDNESAVVPETTMEPYLANNGTTTAFLPQIVVDDALLFQPSNDDDNIAIQEILIVEPTSTVELENGTTMSSHNGDLQVDVRLLQLNPETEDQNDASLVPLTSPQIDNYVIISSTTGNSSTTTQINQSTSTSEFLFEVVYDDENVTASALTNVDTNDQVLTDETIHIFGTSTGNSSTTIQINETTSTSEVLIAMVYEEDTNATAAAGTFTNLGTTIDQVVLVNETVDEKSTDIVDPECSNESLKGHNCDGEGFFRYGNSCTLHYECRYSEQCGKYLQSELYVCPQCLKFNPKKGRCDFPEEVNECTYNNKKKRFCTAPGSYPVPNSCKKYYSCVEGKPITIKTCPKGKIFDENKSKCVRGTKCLSAKKCHGNGSIIDKYDCRRYLRCTKEGTDWRYVKLRCPKGQLFNGAYCQPQENLFLGNWEELNKMYYQN